MQITLTVLFDEPFWVGIFERTDDCGYQVAKVTFGAEPKDCEVYAFVLRNQHKLKFSEPLDVGTPVVKQVNPKRRQREAHSETAAQGIGTKAQNALKLQHETRKTEIKQHNKAVKELAAARKYVFRQEKKKAKHKGH